MMQQRRPVPLEGESGADFVDREQRAYIAQIWELMSMTRSDVPNSSSRIRRTRNTRLWLFTTANMTLNRATSLFETYLPGDTATAAPTVNAIF
jgi:hypothetical protein